MFRPIKKLVFAFIIGFFALGFSETFSYIPRVFNGPGLYGGALLTEVGLDSSIIRGVGLKAVIIGWTNFILSLAAILAVVAIVWAGFQYITSFGDDGKKETGQKIIMYAVIGLLVIFSAFAIVNTVIKGVLNADQPTPEYRIPSTFDVRPEPINPEIIQSDY